LVNPEVQRLETSGEAEAHQVFVEQIAQLGQNEVLDGQDHQAERGEARTTVRILGR